MKSLIAYIFIFLVSFIILILGCRSEGKSSLHEQSEKSTQQTDDSQSISTIQKLMSGMNSID